MKSLELIFSVAVLSALSSPAIHAHTGSATSPILVDGDKVQCPTATFTEIQPAIDAASPGDTILVCRGRYHEQLTIDKSITLEANNEVILTPTGMTANATGLTQSDQIAAAVLVKNATSVTITGFRFDGSENEIKECGPRLIGILFQNASGQLEHNAVRHFRLPSAPGCQSGNAIEVETSSGAQSTVTILNNSVDDYQKNGITANEPGSTVTITGNVVVGLGPTSGAAQNGIQIGFGATGTISNNNVSNHVWAPCVSLTECATDATGVLIFQSDNVKVNGNTIGTNQIGVFTNGNNTGIVSNNISNSLVLDGVLLAGNNGQAQNNNITQSAEAAVDIAGSGNTISFNELLAADFGVLLEPGASGNNHFGNQFFAILKQISNAETPAPAALQALTNSATAESVVAPGTTKAKAAQRVSPSR
jgi:nitrous oxidase accessory protein NosD